MPRLTSIGAGGRRSTIWSGFPVKENATRVQRLARGEVHVAENLTPVEMDELAKNPQAGRAGTVRHERRLPDDADGEAAARQPEGPPGDLHGDRQADAHQGRLRRPCPAGRVDGSARDVGSRRFSWSICHTTQRRPSSSCKRPRRRQAFNLPLKLSLAAMNQARPYLQQPAAIQGYLKDALARDRHRADDRVARREPAFRRI